MSSSTAETPVQQEGFTLSMRDDGIAVITIDIPGESMNVLKAEYMEQANALMDRLEQDKELKGIIYISGKPGSFIAGADIRMLAACETAEEVSALSRGGQEFFNRIERTKVPVVAAVDGVCLGGGLELAMACRGRVATENDKTKLGLPEVQLGLLPGSGGTQRLPRLVGIPAALDMMLTGKQISADRARKMGLVDDVVPASILLDAAVKLVGELSGRRRPKKQKRSLAQRLLEGTPPGRRLIFDRARKTSESKSKGNYPALPRIIDCVEHGAAKGMKRGLEMEARCFGELAMTPEARQLIGIYFATVEMKKDFGTDADVRPRKVRKAAVLGAGLMGAGISYVTTAKANTPVRLKDVSAEGLGRGMKHIDGLISERVKRRSLTPFEGERQLRRVTPALEYTGFNSVDLAIEAVFEDVELKHRMVRDVESNTPSHTVFASNTSSIPIARIAEAAERPENVIGMHYFSPVEKMPLLEVIATDRTSAETIATTVDFGRRQGKTVIVVKDGAGFYVNRILAPYINEACHLLQEGVPIDHIDRTMVQFGFPLGPFALLDEVGLDVSGKVAPILHDAFGERMKPVEAMEAMLKDERYGKKAKKGFYRYDGKKKKGGKEVDQSVYKLLGVEPDNKMNEAEIIDRAVLMMVNEAARCHHEEVIRSLRDGDIGAVFGIGFPPFRGGPFRYMDSRGIGNLVTRLKELESSAGTRFAPAPNLERMAEGGARFHQR
ncbi:MAG: fatty acid oxidation complex subunit alpha FadJ [Ectothiorhodospiraceae bacterium]|nr:fatty acid oxidation complex subunit alpha FadJ [Ectothiorhodospiraceae bacterium]